MSKHKSKTYSFQFWLLCFSSFLFFASFSMLIPELPDYLTSLGGEDYKGYIIGLFTITAGLSRPFSGKLTDKVGRIPVMVIGAAVCFILGFIYPLVTTVFGFLLLRLFHGFSTGFKPTGTVAYIADIVPIDKRGEAMGLSSMFGTIGTAAGFGMGSAIASTFSLNTLFHVSSVFAILSVIILFGMKETALNKEKFRLNHLLVNWSDVYEPSVLLPTLIMALGYFSFGIVLTIIPDFSVHLGIENKGLFFNIFTVSSLLVRILAGKASDRYGRENVMIVSLVLYVVSMVIVGLSTTTFSFFVGATLFGFATGMNSPTIFAWATDLSPEKYRGRAMATVFIGLEVGIMGGAFFSGWSFDNDPANFPLTFFIGALSAAIALTYLIIRARKRRNVKHAA